MTHTARKEKLPPSFDAPRALQAHEHASAIELLNRVLRPNSPPSILQEYPLVLGKDNLANMRVIVHEGNVVAHAAIYFSTLRSGALTLRVGGIGSVATAPEFQRKGLATAVIQDCLNVIREAKCHLAVLWTQRHSFYRRLGFESAGSEHLFLFNASASLANPQQPDIIPFSPALLSEIMAIHDREPLRTERSQREYEAYFSLPKTKTFVAMRYGKVTAYATMGKGEDFPNCVHDWGGQADDALCLLQKLCQVTARKEIAVLTPAEENEFTRLLNRSRARPIFERLAMIKVVNLEELAKEIAANFSQGRASFRIFAKKDNVIIQVGKENARLRNGQLLVRLLFGPERPLDLLEETSSTVAHALQDIFPIPLFIWGLDSI